MQTKTVLCRGLWTLLLSLCVFAASPSLACSACTSLTLQTLADSPLTQLPASSPISSNNVVNAQFEVAANGLPILNSLPNALSIAYMDFDGGNALGGTYRGPFGGDLDFNTTEQQQIYNAWRDVSTHFAMFDINVSTVAPNKSVNPTSHVIISPDVSGGAANVNFHGNTGSQARGQNEASNAISRTTGITHEFGHILGLNHQSEFDAQGNRTKDYRGVDQWNRAPIMGVDFAGGLYAAWAAGPNSSNAFFDEATFIANKIVSVNKSFNPSYNGDGFRPDEHGNLFANATPLSLEQTGTSGTNLLVTAASTGIIERYTDTDMFSIDWGGGSISIFAEAVRDVASAQTYASSVNLNLRVFDSNGVQVAENLAVNPADVNTALNMSLDPGQYFLSFSGSGIAGSLGAYTLDIDGVMQDNTVIPYELIYYKSTGRVVLDTKNGRLINYVLEGPGGFIEQRHTLVMPFGTNGSVDFQIAESSLLGNSGLLSIGNVLPAGLDQAQLESIITRKTYVAALGKPISEFELAIDDRFAVFYDAETGELTIDTLGQMLINYVLEGSGFIEENHTLVMPFGTHGSVDFQIAESSLLGNSGVLSIGNVLPAGLTPEELAAFFTRMTYVSKLGTPVTTFELGYYYITGDLDLDADVDDADFGIAFANFTGPGGTGMTSYEGDLDGDGDIDDADFGIAFAHFTGPGDAPVNVPEPTTLATLALGALLLRSRRRIAR